MPGTQLTWLTGPAHQGEVRVEPGGQIPKCEPVQATGFERLATAEVRRRGWTHVIAAESVPWVRAAVANPQRWGIEVLQRNRELLLIALQ